MFPKLREWTTFYFAPVPHPEVQSYQYGRLPPGTRSFRVFHILLPRAGDQTPGDDLSGALRGRIEVMDIDKGCRYDALSYCWEGSIDPSPYARQRKDRILIEESDRSQSQLLISPALSTALRYLRARGQSLPLFVDQICINQADDSEKSRQINLMGDIYRNCACVVAWLDVATKYTDALFNFLPRITGSSFLLQSIRDPPQQARVLKAAMEKRNDFGDDEMLRQEVETVIGLAREHWGQFPHRGFLDVCLRRWFRRIWIIQEACLGSKMVFVCGRRSCSVEALEVANEFRLLASSVQRFEAARPLEDHQAKWDKGLTHMSHQGTTVLSRIFRERATALATLKPSPVAQQIMGRRGLANLVTRFNVDTMANGPWVRLGSSNPRDFIYALKGLASDGDSVSKRLVTDCKLPPATIFTDFTRLLFDASIGTPAIDTLLLSQMETKRLRGLPSWVPDWSTNVVLPYGYRVGCYPMFNAGGGNKKPYTHSEVDVSRPGILRVKGVLLCEIDRVGVHFMDFCSGGPAHPLESPSVLPRSIFHFFREVRELCDWASRRPNSASIPSAADLDETIWLTTTGGHGLMQTTEGSPLGSKAADGKPLLGHLWDFQLQMDVLPAIMKRRRDGLASITTAWAASTTPGSTGYYRFPLLLTLHALVVYWANRLLVEVLHLYWLYRFYIMKPYLRLRPDMEDMLYTGIFGVQKTNNGIEKDIGILKSVLDRHTRRKCFVSRRGHAGLGPVGTQRGDVVVVLLGMTVPIVLRPDTSAKDLWVYVGEAYCHGFMDAEALAAGNGLNTRWFDIK